MFEAREYGGRGRALDLEEHMLGDGSRDELRVLFISILMTIHDDLRRMNASTVGADLHYDI
jgi:hypothetical protein